MQTVLTIYGLWAIFWFVFFCKTSETKTSMNLIAKVVLSLLWGIFVPITIYSCVKNGMKSKEGEEEKDERG